MKKTLLFLFCFLIFSYGQLKAQIAPEGTEEQFEHLIEQLIPIPEDDLSYELIYENLLQYFNHPLDLNKAGAEELQSLFLLTEPQIQSFFRHIERNGKLLSIYEIQAIPAWDLGTIHRLLPFITVAEVGIKKDSSPLLKRIRELGRNMWLIRYERVFENRAGYKAKSDSLLPVYLGAADKIFSRFRLNRPHDFSFGFTLEKDPGEKFIWDARNKQYGPDFISFHGMLYELGRLRKVIVGDFQLQYGQSLVFGAGFSLGKGAETITTIRRSNIGLQPYTSVGESGFFRGAGATFQISPSLELTAFYSSSPQDAIIIHPPDNAGTPSSAHFNSLQQSGLHRTEREIQAKGSIRERSSGGILHFRSKNKRLQVGATALLTNFSNEWKRNKSLFYNQFEFQGKENAVASLFAEYIWQNIHLFSEIARSQSSGKGIMAGTMIALTPQLDFAFLARKYDRNFHSFYSSGFREGSRNINEQGMYWGIKFQPIKAFSFNAYFDRFQFPWLRYRVYAPSEGYEFLLRANYKPNRNLLLYAQFREEVKDINTKLEPLKTLALPGTKRNFLLNLDASLLPSVNFRSRVQWSSYDINQSFTQGFAIVQDVNWHRNKLKVSGRMALFDTQDYNNRQYVYEKDVLWAFSIPAYYGTGVRNYLLIQYKFNQHFTIWVRMARTFYSDREQISSGNERIEGSSLHQFKAQLRVLF